MSESKKIEINTPQKRICKGTSFRECGYEFGANEKTNVCPECGVVYTKIQEKK